MKVVVVVEDSLPNRFVSEQNTPALWRLIRSHGGWSEQGGRSVLASSTFSNHATLVTGADVQGHRIFTNKVWDGEQFICASVAGPQLTTLFDVASEHGLSSAAVMGDATMIGVTAAERARLHWPPMNETVPLAAVDSLGYAANSVVLDHLDKLEALSCDFCLIHMNEPDSALHAFGPDSEQALAQIRRCDQDLASIVERLQPDWGDTVLFVLSDHEQEAIDPSYEALQINTLLAAHGLTGNGHDEGAVALVVGGADARSLSAIPEIDGVLALDTDHVLVWSGAGRVFGSGRKTVLGQHGSPRTRTQVATVAGGHPMVPRLSEAVRSCSPHATQWAPTIARLLGFSLPHSTGQALI